MLALGLLPFSISLFWGGPQWLVGTIVNFCLYLGVILLPKKYIFPMVILPSIGVLARGLIFGPLTLFLLYFLPFIWLANLIMILIFKRLYDCRKNIWSIFIASMAKFLFLTIIAFIYIQFNLVPAAFLQLMGTMQLLTALAGGLITWYLLIVYEKIHTRNRNID